LLIVNSWVIRLAFLWLNIYKQRKKDVSKMGEKEELDSSKLNWKKLGAVEIIGKFAETSLSREMVERRDQLRLIKLFSSIRLVFAACSGNIRFENYPPYYVYGGRRESLTPLGARKCRQAS